MKIYKAVLFVEKNVASEFVWNDTAKRINIIFVSYLLVCVIH